MAKSFSEYTSVFFWDFKRMDNVNYNFQIIETLFKIKMNHDGNEQLNKPIILILAAIIECILYDFIRRVTEHRKELIPGLDEKIIDDTRDKICDQFEPLIAHARKHDLLQDNHGKIYQDLDFIRKLRNRIHIQNRQEQLDRDEFKIWTDANIMLASQALEKVCDTLCNTYPRPNEELISMIDFPRPWQNK